MMNKALKRILIFIACLIALFLIGIAMLVFGGKGKLMLPVSQKEAFELQEGAEYASALFVEDTRINNEMGEQVILKGMMVPEVKELDIGGEFHEEYFEGVFECGGNAVRIPVHPDRWNEDQYYLWRYLDPIVSWAVEKEKYVIIDLHFIGNIATGAGDEMKNVGQNPYAFSVAFWDAVASYFKDVPNVIFEIYNEPAVISDMEWAKYANGLVDTIRNTGANQLILVSGIDYSYDPSCWAENPITAANIAYTAHIFPNRENSIENFERLADRLPLVVTEWGFIAETEIAKQDYLLGDRASYGEPMIQFMEKYKIGWIAAWYDDKWEPPMFFENTNKRTDWGDFIMDELK